MERRRTLAGDVPEEILLAGDVVVERGLLQAERVGEVGERRALVALLGEQAGGDPGQLLTSGGHL